MTSVPLEHLREHSLIYLMTPYTKHPDGREYAYKVAAAYLAHLSASGLRVYSPITHWHTASMLDPQSRMKWFTPDEWFEINLPMMEMSDCAALLDLPETEESDGIAREIHWFAEQKLPVYKIDRVRMRATRY